MELHPVGTRVTHMGHGLGTVVGYNGRPAPTYDVLKKGNEEVLVSAIRAGLVDTIVDSFYSADRYPYVIQYDAGYKDVYDIDDCVVQLSKEKP